MQTISQVQRDISYQECGISGQPAPLYVDNSSQTAFQAFSSSAPPPATPNLQCHTMTTFQSALAQSPSSGKTKWKSSAKHTVQRYSFPAQQMQPLPPPQMFFNTANAYHDPRAPLLPSYDPYYYTNQPQPYYAGSYPYANGYRPQPPVQTPPPRPYLTITQFNYQPAMGYNPHAQGQAPPPAGLVFGPPPRDRRCVTDSQCRFYTQHGASQYDTDRPITPSRLERSEPPKLLYHKSATNSCTPYVDDRRNFKRSDTKSESSCSFEFTIQPEQIVNSLCDEKEQDCLQCREQDNPTKPDDEAANPYSSPRMWAECEFMDPMRIEDDDLTKFIVDGCLKAEAIAVRNQHRPCFKNIKHLCTRTRTDILKPRTTVANIHSQGIPWATKDFIFAFVRLINCWYILKGYLDDHEGSLGKIENALIPEFKECYQRWQGMNKEMVKHLINIFVNLDNGISVQNAEIFSSFNQGNIKNTSPSNCSLPCNTSIDKQPKATSSKSCHSKFPQDQSEGQNKNLVDAHFETKIENEVYQEDIESIEDKLKCSYLDGRVSVPGILRVKDMFTNPTNNNQSKCEEDADSDRECRHSKVYMKPGSYRVPKKILSSSSTTPRSLDLRELPSLTEHPEGSTHLDHPKNHLTHTVVQTDQDPSSADDIWRSALESFGPFIQTVIKDSESFYESLTNESQSPEKPKHSNESTDEDSEDLDNSVQTKTFKSTKDTQAWVNEHDFESYMDENIEVMSDLGKLDKRTTGLSRPISKKNIVSSRTYRKRNDDIDSSKMNKNKSGGEDRTNKQKHDPNIVNSMCFQSRRKFGLSPVTVSKFEKIINALWNLQFAKYITFEVNVENVPDYYKFINKPMFLYKVMNNLKQNKYSHPYEVVHDLRTIVRNSEIYVEKRPDWWFEKCLTTFSKELETQLAEKFASIDFSSVSGDPSQPPRFVTTNKTNEQS